jgi:hypothetical protein
LQYRLLTYTPKLYSCAGTQQFQDPEQIIGNYRQYDRCDARRPIRPSASWQT